MSGEIIEAGRSLEQVTQGIRVLTAQTVANMCQLGKLLTEAKSMVGHGEWGKYLEEQVSYSQSTANNFMRLYAEYGEFGPNSQTFGNLTTGQALELLKLPAGEREAFAESHDVESMSIRQLRQQIADEKKRADDAERLNAHLSAQLAESEDACSGYPKDIEELEQELSSEKSHSKALRAQLAVATEEIGAAQQRAENWQRQSADWQDKASQSAKETRTLRANVTHLETELATARAQAGRISPEELSRIRDEERATVIRTVADSHKRELGAANDRIAELEAQLEEAQAQDHKISDREAAKALVKAAAVSLGEDCNRLHGYFLKYQSDSQLSGAIRNLVIRQIEILQQKFDIDPV